MISIGHFTPKTMNFTIFSSAHRGFSRIDHILSHKSSIGKLKNKQTKKTSEIIASVFSDHNTVRLDVNYGRKITITNINIYTPNIGAPQFIR